MIKLKENSDILDVFQNILTIPEMRIFNDKIIDKIYLIY